MSPAERLRALEKYLALAWGNGSIDSPTLLQATNEIETTLRDLQVLQSKARRDHARAQGYY